MEGGKIRYALGDFGKLHQFSGGDIPEGTTALVEEHDEGLTSAGKEFCKKRSMTANVEAIRVQFYQQNSSAIIHAAEASIKNQEIMQQRHELTKSMSEKLREDWAAQDKAYQAAEAAKKKAALAKS